MPRSQSSLLRSGLLSAVALEETRLGKKKRMEKDNVTKNISNLNNKHEELGDFEKGRLISEHIE